VINILIQEARLEQIRNTASAATQTLGMSKRFPERRSRMETFCDVLRVLGACPLKPTHIMYKANLSWNVMHECLTVLEKRDLVAQDIEKGAKMFHLTPQGFEVLGQFLEIRSDLGFA
jgi:predicted transcriptional regulator